MMTSSNDLSNKRNDLQTWMLGAKSKDVLSLYLGRRRGDDEFTGRSMANTWEAPKELKIRNKSFRNPDFLSFDLCAPAVSQKAKDALEPLIGQDCEFLPLVNIKKKQYYALNVLKVIDCLDLHKSDIQYRHSDPTQIVNVHRYVFDERKIPQGTVIFKIPQDRACWAFVRVPFINCVMRKYLTGAQFYDPAGNNIGAFGLGYDANVVLGLPL